MPKLTGKDLSKSGSKPGSKTVLLVGSGGREHALAWKLGLSPKLSRKIAVPGNDGFPGDWERWDTDLSLSGNLAQREFERLAELAIEARVDLAVIGPDNPLAEGIVDVFEKHGVRCFGPTARAAQIEASKSFCKDVMTAASVPTAKYFVSSSIEDARKILRTLPWDINGGWVIKADGLFFGKGVRVCETLNDAITAAEELMRASGKLVIEEKLFGREISWFAFCDGESCSLLEPARDHKTLREGGQGPNTGGMGAFSPVAEVPVHWNRRVREEVFLPVLREMKKRGTPFKGVLFAGLMCDFSHDRFWVLEFNARFGDPEAQVCLARMDGDLFDWCEAVSHGELEKFPSKVPFNSGASVVVVAAAAGYPEKPEKGRRIDGLFEQESDMTLPPYFFAGVTREPGGKFVTSGGRVLGAMGLGASLLEARKNAYQGMERVSFAGMQYRRDIGQENGESA